MNVIVIILILVALLFAAAFFTKRRFGVLGLALTAGATLSKLWATDLTPYVQNAGVKLIAPPLESVVAAVVILLPAIVLLFSGPTYHKLWQKIVGSAVFALLAIAFLLGPLGNALVLEGNGQTIYVFLVNNQTWIITGSILYALFDVLAVKTPKHKKEKE
jgi:hypothetical protein